MSGETPAVREALAVYATETPEMERVPPGYRRTEVGVIPEDWEVSSIGREFTIQLGKMLDAAKNVGVLKPYIGNRAVQWARIDLEDLATVAMTPSDLQRFRLRRGDLLVCEGGEIGRAALWNEPIAECYYQKALHRLRPIRGYEALLLLYLLQLWTSSGYLANYVTQTSIAHLPKDKFESVPLAIPPESEQHAIAAALSDVDVLIAALDKLIAKKRAVKIAAMQQLLTGEQRLPGFSGEWEVKRLGKVADVDSDNLTGDTDPNYQFNYISLEDVDRGVLRSFSHQHFSSAPSRARRRVRPGDVLVSTVRPNLKSHFLFSALEGNWVCSTGFSVVRCQKRLASPGFIYQHLFHGVLPKQIEALIAGSNYPAISAKDVKAFQIPMPGVEEQTAIATVLSDMDAEIAALEARWEKTRRIKQGMMQELLTGRTRLV